MANNTNFRQPVEAQNAALANYLVEGGKVNSKSVESQTKTGNAALATAKAVVDSLTLTLITIRGTAEAEAIALDIASGSIASDAKFVSTAIRSLDERVDLLSGADKAFDEAVKAFKAMISNQIAAAAAAKSALKPADKAGDNKGDNNKGGDSKKS
ncbi:MAG TPA: hypothetical protein V6D22_00030 [Candidatus Obscuribacterales bacterium]